MLSFLPKSLSPEAWTEYMRGACAGQIESNDVPHKELAWAQTIGINRSQWSGTAPPPSKGFDSRILLDLDGPMILNYDPAVGRPAEADGIYLGTTGPLTWL